MGGFKICNIVTFLFQEDDLEKVCDEIIEKYNQICANAAKDESGREKFVCDQFSALKS